MLKHFPLPPDKPQQAERYSVEFGPTTPPQGIITRLNIDGETTVAITPANVLQVKQLLYEVTAGGIELEEVV